MEKTLDDFYKSGKVTDYLAYRGVSENTISEEKEQEEDGTVSCGDGNGTYIHAYQ